MYDSLGQEIAINDEIWADEPIDGFLTYERLYTVKGLREEEGRVVITDDRGLEGWYRSTRFVKGNPVRSGAV